MPIENLTASERRAKRKRFLASQKRLGATRGRMKAKGASARVTPKKGLPTGMKAMIKREGAVDKKRPSGRPTRPVIGGATGRLPKPVIGGATGRLKKKPVLTKATGRLS